MKEYINPFRQFLKENTTTGTTNEYTIDANVIVSNDAELMKTEILSHIRAIPGITRVNVSESTHKVHYYITKLNIKIDPEPFKLQSVENILEFIKQKVLQIDSVRRFSYTSKLVKL